MTVMMEEILIEPTEEWLPEAAAYKRAFEAAGDSMDGTGNLRTAQDMAQWLQTCRDFKRRETTPPQLVPATQLIYVRPADHALLGMLQVKGYENCAIVVACINEVNELRKEAKGHGNADA